MQSKITLKQTLTLSNSGPDYVTQAYVFVY